MKWLGKNVATYRERRGLTRKQLAAMIGVNPWQVGSWERKARNIVPKQHHSVLTKTLQPEKVRRVASVVTQNNEDKNAQTILDALQKIPDIIEMLTKGEATKEELERVCNWSIEDRDAVKDIGKIFLDNYHPISDSIEAAKRQLEELRCKEKEVAKLAVEKMREHFQEEFFF